MTDNETEFITPTPRFVTVYELSKVITERAKEIASGDVPRVHYEPCESPYVIAEREVRAHKIEYIITRTLPSKITDSFSINEAVLPP